MSHIELRRDKDLPESAVVVTFGDVVLPGIDEKYYGKCVWNFGADLNKRLKLAGYKRVRFMGKSTAPPAMGQPGVWGLGPGQWALRVGLDGGRWPYHASRIEALVKAAEKATHDWLAKSLAELAAEAAKAPPVEVKEP